jgi:hypothetical protein
MSWQPKICIESTHFYHPAIENSTSIDVCVIDKKSDQYPQLVNLALFLNPSISTAPSLSYVRSKILGYPPNAVLQLESFYGLEEEKAVLSTLKNAAAAGGTVLVVEKIRKGGR